MATPPNSPSPTEQKPSQTQSPPLAHTTKLDPPKQPFGIAFMWFVVPILLIVVFKCS